MKFSCTQENLKQSLGVVAHIAGKNVNLPILSNILVEARDNAIHFSATDLEIGISYSMRGKVETEGSFTVQAKLFSDYINLLPNKRVDIEVDDLTIKITCDSYKTKMRGDDATDYPVLPQIEKKGWYAFDFEQFKKAVSEVLFAAAANETRIELSGVYFELGKEQLTIAATDSYRLAERKIEYFENKSDTSETRRLIIPVKTLQEVLRLSSPQEALEGKKEAVLRLYTTENQILFVFNDSELISRVIEGQYPNYQQIIPQQPRENKTMVTIQRSELIRAVKAASLFSKASINDIHIDVPQGKNSVVISAVGGQGGESTAEIEATTSGKDNGVVLNYKYFLDGLSVLGVEDVVVEIIDATTPCAIKPEGRNDYLYIIMPIRQ